MSTAHSKYGSLLKGLRRYWCLYLLLIPILAYYLIYRYYPMLLQVVLAFKNYRFADGVWGSQWVGLANINRMLSHTDLFIILRNTITISLLRLIAGFFPPIIVAILLYDVKNAAFKRVSQTLLYIPHFFSWAIIYGIVFAFFSNDGAINNLIASFGGEKVDFLLKERYFLPLLIGSGLWKEVGWGTIIYLAALTGINTELFDAAKIDGAGPVSRIIHITLPGIVSVVIFMLILSVGNILKNVGSEQILLFYTPATYGVGDVIDTWVYRQGLHNLQYSLAASVAFFQSFIGLLLVLSINRLAKKMAGVSIW